MREREGLENRVCFLSLIIIWSIIVSRSRKRVKEKRGRKIDFNRFRRNIERKNLKAFITISK